MITRITSEVFYTMVLQPASLQLQAILSQMNVLMNLSPRSFRTSPKPFQLLPRVPKKQSPLLKTRKNFSNGILTTLLSSRSGKIQLSSWFKTTSPHSGHRIISLRYPTRMNGFTLLSTVPSPFLIPSISTATTSLSSASRPLHSMPQPPFPHTILTTPHEETWPRYQEVDISFLHSRLTIPEPGSCIAILDGIPAWDSQCSSWSARARFQNCWILRSYRIRVRRGLDMPLSRRIREFRFEVFI